MKLGDRSEFIIQPSYFGRNSEFKEVVLRDKSVKFTVDLLHVSQDIPNERQIKIASLFKEQGNAFFKDNRLKEAK